ncbi:MAG: hypothetical protein KGQ88_09780, partial [Chloroflexi bacterium]|nr:hypothetical protein [Chloroflexota bacterium]
MIEFEKRGVPTVAFVARGFEHDAARSAKSFGLEGLPFAVAESTFTSHTADDIRAMVNACFDDLERGLRRAPATAAPATVVRPSEEWLSFDGADTLAALDALNERSIEGGWGDGFPVVPPTKDRLERMLAGTTRAHDAVVAVLEPGFGVATVEKIAANAVMAGCLPQHLPVVIAAVE